MRDPVRPDEWKAHSRTSSGETAHDRGERRQLIIGGPAFNPAGAVGQDLLQPDQIVGQRAANANVWPAGGQGVVEEHVRRTDRETEFRKPRRTASRRVRRGIAASRSPTHDSGGRGGSRDTLAVGHSPGYGPSTRGRPLGASPSGSMTTACRKAPSHRADHPTKPSRSRAFTADPIRKPTVADPANVQRLECAIGIR